MDQSTLLGLNCRSVLFAILRRWLVRLGGCPILVRFLQSYVCATVFVDDKASDSCKVSWVCLVVSFPLGVFEELLGDVLGASLFEEIFGELPKFRGGFSWLRHGR